MRLLIGDEAKETTQTTKTDRERGYQFFFLAPGRYTLTAAHEGFQNERRAVLRFRLITINRAQTSFRVLRDCSEFTRGSDCRRESGERVAVGIVGGGFQLLLTVANSLRGTLNRPNACLATRWVVGSRGAGTGWSSLGPTTGCLLFSASRGQRSAAGGGILQW